MIEAEASFFKKSSKQMAGSGFTVGTRDDDGTVLDLRKEMLNDVGIEVAGQFTRKRGSSQSFFGSESVSELAKTKSSKGAERGHHRLILYLIHKKNPPVCPVRQTDGSGVIILQCLIVCQVLFYRTLKSVEDPLDFFRPGTVGAMGNVAAHYLLGSEEAFFKIGSGKVPAKSFDGGGIVGELEGAGAVDTPPPAVVGVGRNAATDAGLDGGDSQSPEGKRVRAVGQVVFLTGGNQVVGVGFERSAFKIVFSGLREKVLGFHGVGKGAKDLGQRDVKAIVGLRVEGGGAGRREGRIEKKKEAGG